MVGDDPLRLHDRLVGRHARAASRRSTIADSASAFGEKLIDQPLMRDVLADLALEAEAALALTLRIGPRARRRGERRAGALGTALGKYWICKRAPAHAYEAMECIGGSA